MILKDFKKLNVDVLLTRSCSGEHNFILSITDQNSRMKVAEILIAPESAADFFSARPVGAICDLCHSENLGKLYESKIVKVPVSVESYKTKLSQDFIDEVVKTAIQINPDWNVREREFNGNHMNYINKTYSLIMYRYV